jgi:mono/diheme cytochrome c family protein
MMTRLLACLLMLTPVAAAAQDVERGRALATRWCANCHVVDRTTDRATADGPPTFPAIAAKPESTADFLRAKMSAAHGKMPDLSLTKREQDDLVAYISSLRQK